MSPSPPETDPDVRPRLRLETCAAKFDSTTPALTPTGVVLSVEDVAAMGFGLAALELGSGGARAAEKLNKEEVRLELELLTDLFERKESTLSSFDPLPKIEDGLAEGAGEVVCSRWIGG